MVRVRPNLDRRGTNNRSDTTMDPAHDLIPMTLLTAGQMGRIAAMVGGADQIHRLRELGLRDGAEVEMVRPGSPCIIRLGGQKLGLRSDEMARVLVRP